MTRAFNVYVRPLLEYASHVWSPQVDKVESIQRRFTERLRVYSHLDYPSHLNALALMSLEKCRLVQDLVLTYKIIFGLLDIDSRKFFLKIRPIRCVNNVTRGNPYNLSVNNCRINVRQHYFAERVVSVWDSLSPSVDFSSLSAFKRTIYNARLNLYTKY